MWTKELKHKIITLGRILLQVRSYNYPETIIEENGKIEKKINENLRKIYLQGMGDERITKRTMYVSQNRRQKYNHYTLK